MERPEITPQCLVCGYTLLGLTSNTCPECGQVFSPDDPRTYTGRWSERLVRRMRPPTLRSILIVAAMTLYGIYAASVPRECVLLWLVDSFRWLFASFLIFVVAGIDIAIRLHVRDRFVLLPSPKRTVVRYGKWRWFVVPVCAVVLLSAVFTTWPLVVRFQLSRPAFEDQVAALQAGKSPNAPRRVGLYWVQHIDYKGPNDIFFSQASRSRFTTTGFRYAPLLDKYGHAHRVADSWFAYKTDS